MPGLSRILSFTATGAFIACIAPVTLLAQDGARPELHAAALDTPITIDGALDDAAWSAAPATDAFLQIEPDEGGSPSMRTTVRVLAGPGALVIGIVCQTPDPAAVVSFSVRRDAQLAAEDHVRVVLGPFMDGRSGYVFAVNPSGARYDAIVNPGDGTENGDWDGIWEAATARTATGWSVEMRIPLQTLSFKPGLHEWHFNVQRRIQRALETDRWASPGRQYQITQTSRAGLLTGLPDFNQGLGLTLRPAVTSGGGVPAHAAPVGGKFQPSLDVTQRLGSGVIGSLTVNTDFAETEVDTRRTNLTRFPLFFPEKRTFFLEGADIFSFGFGLGQDVIPFFSRRVGLVSGSAVPIAAGGKVNGRVGSTSGGGIAVGTRTQPGVVDASAAMSVGRVKRNLWSESWIGAIATTGDPEGRSGSWLGGVDFTYSTSRFHGNRNFRTGTWLLATGRDGLGADSTAYGVVVDYPNDSWDLNFTYKRIGRDFDPSLGFVPRRAVQLMNGQFNNRRRTRGPFQQVVHQFQPLVAIDLHNRWESYYVKTTPANWRFRSGDRFEINANPAGERLSVPFEVARGVVIPPGSYHWRRYLIEGGTAQKRRVYTQVSWWFGGFYTGTLDQVIWSASWNPAPLLTVELTGERNVGNLATGRFRQTLIGNRLRVNLSPDLSIASYVQYDTDSDSVGMNTRMRWTFTPVADLFIVYNHNVRSLLERWQLESNQLLIKLQYAWRR